MIKKSVFEDELIHGMQRELRSEAKKQGMQNLAQAADHLHSAMEILEETGMESQANKVFNILRKIAQEANKPKDPTKINDKHTSGLTSKKQVKNLIDHGTVFNMADDGADILNAEIGDVPLEVTDSDTDKSFEDEEDNSMKTVAKYGQRPPTAAPPAAPPVAAPAAKAPPAAVPAAAPAAVAPPAAAPTPTSAEAAASAAAKKAALEAAKAAASAAATAAKDAAAKLKELEKEAPPAAAPAPTAAAKAAAVSMRKLLSKYSDNAAPSAHIRGWDPSAKETESNKKPSINHVEGNVGTDRKATDAGVDAPSRKATDSGVNSGVNVPSHKTDPGVNAPSKKATDGDASDARTAGGAKVDNDAAAKEPAEKEPAEKAPTGGSGGNGPSDVRSPTSTEVRSPTSTEVRSPTSTEVRSPTSTSTEVRSPTSTSTEAYTADNFTATVTGGAGAGANTTVNIYVLPQNAKKPNQNIPESLRDKEASVNYLMSKYG